MEVKLTSNEEKEVLKLEAYRLSQLFSERIQEIQLLRGKLVLIRREKEKWRSDKLGKNLTSWIQKENRSGIVSTIQRGSSRQEIKIQTGSSGVRQQNQYHWKRGIQTKSGYQDFAGKTE